MKNLILSVLVLFALVNTANAADKKNSALVNDDKIGTTVKETHLSPPTYAALEEENVQLRHQTAQLSNQFDELKNKFDYSEMMHITLVTLQLQELMDSAENARIQLDYARMMNTTLINLSKL